MPTLHLAAHASNVAVARRFVRELLEEWGCREEIVDSAVLCASELVTNAVLHARTPATVNVRRVDGAVRMEVGDKSPALPVVRTTDAVALAGRGMHILAAFSSRCGSEPTRDGKIVWAEVDSG